MKVVDKLDCVISHESMLDEWFKRLPNNLYALMAIEMANDPLPVYFHNVFEETFLEDCGFTNHDLAITSFWEEWLTYDPIHKLHAYLVMTGQVKSVDELSKIDDFISNDIETQFHFMFRGQLQNYLGLTYRNTVGVTHEQLVGRAIHKCLTKA